VDASRRNWKAPDNKLLEILFMFTGNFVHVYWKKKSFVCIYLVYTLQMYITCIPGVCQVYTPLVYMPGIHLISELDR
jgi:hypothetical protein